MTAKICTYCGEHEGVKWIPNPNVDKCDSWWVCATCQIIIRLQQRMTFAMWLGEKLHDRKMMKEAERLQEEINAIAKGQGTPVCTVILKKRVGDEK